MCVVSFDATWHRRGHYSNQGFTAAIEVYSGKVLDYVLTNMYAINVSGVQRSARKTVRKNSVNTGRSIQVSVRRTSLELVRLWSLQLPLEFGLDPPVSSLAYTTYVGDGDSYSFKRFVEIDPYKGMEIVLKEKCLGHTQKSIKNI